MKKLYIGNLPYSVKDEDLAAIFAEAGTVISATVIFDRATKRSKGFGFVEMEDADADNAISTLDGKEIDGRAMRVSEARPKEEKRNNGFDRNRR